MGDGDITVYERGEVEKRIDPKLLEIIAIDDLQVGINKVNQHLEKAEFKGIIDPRTLSATEKVQVLTPLRNFPFVPWITASFFNDGPDTVYIVINHANDWIPLVKGEKIDMSFSRSDDRIQFIDYKCDAGKTATVRVVGKY